ncbi:MAG: hypothetical protein K0U98_23310 [Deltaproteobacteria bacterium]|nr:hypothetical protein [Deltaproteobacteria bacterium]
MTGKTANRNDFWHLTLLVIALATFLPAGQVWAQPVEICDGIDNDGNGLIDEGFDTDGDGVARCCNKDPFYVTRNIGSTQLHAHHSNSCSPAFPAPTFNTGPQPLAEVPFGSTLQVNGVGDFIPGGTLEVIWTTGGVRQISMCNGVEWQTRPAGAWTYQSYFGGADLDGDSTLDLVGWTKPFSASLSGMTAFNFGWGGELYPSYSLTPLIPEWGTARTYNLEDVDSDNLPDMVYHGYANGGPSETKLYFLKGAGGTFLPPIPVGFIGPNSVPSVPSQPQNWGDLGDINGDGCTDWVGGPDDDGDRGGVFAFYGDCSGNFPWGPQLVADACVGACPGMGSAHGSGMSQLYDWDCDGDLELLTSHVVFTGSTASVTYWDNFGGTFGNPVVLINNAPNTLTIASPLRN